MPVFRAEKNYEFCHLRLVVSKQERLILLAIAVKVGVHHARTGLRKVLEEERSRIGVEFLQCQQMIAGKTTQDFSDIALPLLST
jgi:hypothetical protein